MASPFRFYDNTSDNVGQFTKQATIIPRTISNRVISKARQFLKGNMPLAQLAEYQDLIEGDSKLDQITSKTGISNYREYFDSPITKSDIGTPVRAMIKYSIAIPPIFGETTTDPVTGQQSPPQVIRPYDKIEYTDYTAIISVKNTKNIVKTVVQGRNRSRKEYVSGGDYSISIKGVITSLYPNKFPEKDVKNAKKIFGSPEAIGVYSPFLSTLGIDGLVIKDWSVNQVKGSHNTVNYTLTADYEPSKHFVVVEREDKKDKWQKTLSKVNEWVALDSAFDTFQIPDIDAAIPGI